MPKWSNIEHYYYPDYDAEMQFPAKGNQEFLEKWVIPGLGQEMQKMSSEYSVIAKKSYYVKIGNWIWVS